jgi:hypothetical protein
MFDLARHRVPVQRPDAVPANLVTLLALAGHQRLQFRQRDIAPLAAILQRVQQLLYRHPTLAI